MTKGILLCIMIFICLQICKAQGGKLDSLFGKNGITTTNIGAKYNYGSPPAKQILLHADARIYVLQESLSRWHSDGTLDSSFGLNGFSENAGFNVNGAAIQSDGKIVVVGGDGYKFIVARYNTNGRLDSNFSNDGKVIAEFDTPPQSQEIGYSVAVQKNGKIVVAGLSNYYTALARYNTDGNLDTAFSNDGKVTSSLASATLITIQPDGKIVVVGTSSNGGDFALLRYNSNGSLDKTFSNDGIQTTDFNSEANKPSAVALAGDGKIVVAGNSTGSNGSEESGIIARYNIDGSLDKSFSGDGKQISTGRSFNKFNAVAIQVDNKIIVAGSSLNVFALERFNVDGSLDKSFSEDGKQTTNFGVGDKYYPHGAYALQIQPDGKIVGGGASGNVLALARYEKNGSLDSNFDKDGKLTYAFLDGNTTLTKTAIQKDGKIVATGYTWNDSNYISFVARYDTTGTLDKTFSEDGIQYPSFDVASLALQSDGKIIVTGSAFVVARYKTDGSIDSTFSNDGLQTTDFGTGTYNTQAKSIAIQDDGKIVVVGETSMYKGESDEDGESMAIARFNTDGSLDWRSIRDLFLYSSANSVAIQKNGKIVVGGYADELPYFQEFAIVRYNTDGSPDYNFGNFREGVVRTGFDIYLAIINSIAIQSDGKIVAAGTAREDGGQHQIALARYTVEGQLDTSLSNDGILMSDFDHFANTNSVVVEGDGKIIVAGTDLLRYNIDGTLDSTFRNTGAQTNPSNINSIAIWNDKLYAAGSLNNNPGNVGAVARYLLDKDNNTPPTVSITTPTNNTTYLAPAAHIKLFAAAADKDGTISKVEFYNGTTLLHTETVAPYGFVWRNVSLGNYTITAKAYDNSGLVTTSAPVHISVVPNKPPTVSIINPANNQSYPAPANIHLEAAAKDPDGRITKVEFYNGSTLLQTELKPPYTFAWRNVPVGNYNIIAKATDNWGAVTTSAVIRVSVHPNIAPTVSITSPANGEGFTAPAIIDLAASAKDADGRITKVEFYNGTVLLRTERKLPYSYHWQNVPAGTHTITAVATDNYGLETTSVAVKVTVTNAMIVSSRPSKDDKTTSNHALQLRVFPNPARDIVNITTEGLQRDKPATLAIVSASGVVAKTMQLEGFNQTVEMNVSSLSSGVYTIKLTGGSKTLYKQFVKL